MTACECKHEQPYMVPRVLSDAPGKHTCDLSRKSVPMPPFVKDDTGVGAMDCHGLDVEIEQELPDSFTNWMRAAENTSVLIDPTAGDDFSYALNAFDASDMDPASNELLGLYRTKQVLESFIKVRFAFADGTPYRCLLGPRESTTSPLLSEGYFQKLPLFKSGYLDRAQGAGGRTMWHHFTMDKLTGYETKDLPAYQWDYGVSAPSKYYLWYLQVYNDTEDATADPIEIHVEIWYKIKWSRPFCLLNPALGVSQKKYRIHGKDVTRREFYSIVHPDREYRARQDEEEVETASVLAPPSVSAMSRESSRALLRK